MSSGVMVTVRHGDHGAWLPEQEAACTVVNGQVVCEATWDKVPAGLYTFGKVTIPGKVYQPKLITASTSEGASFTATFTFDFATDCP